MVPSERLGITGSLRSCSSSNEKSLCAGLRASGPSLFTIAERIPCPVLDFSWFSKRGGENIECSPRHEVRELASSVRFRLFRLLLLLLKRVIKHVLLGASEREDQGGQIGGIIAFGIFPFSR